MNTHKHRILSALLAGLMTASTLLTLSSCAEGEEKKTEAEEKTQSQQPEQTGNLPDVPKDLCPDTTITFLTRGGTGEWRTVDIYSSAVTGEVIGDAVWERNRRVENDYNVTILDLPSETIPDAVNKENASGSNSFQAIVTKLGEMATLASAGNILDLAETEYINLEKSWWDAQAVSGLSLGGRVFFATGDLLTSDNDGTFILMFNKEMAANENLDNLYDLVAQKKWTIEQMFAMEKKVSRDTTGDGEIKFDEDIIGFANTGNVPYSMYYGIGITTCVKDSDDIPVYALDVERLADHVQTLYDICGNKSYAVNVEEGGNGVVENGKKCFGEGHALFFGECMQCITRLRGYSTTFGVIPYPMANEEQGRYYCHMNEIGGMVAIPKTVDAQLDAISGIIEVMAAYSVDTLTPAYYDRSLIGQGTRDEESEPMIRLILESRIYDLGYVYGWGGVAGALRDVTAKGNTKIASSLASKKKVYDRAMQVTLKAFGLD